MSASFSQVSSSNNFITGLIALIENGFVGVVRIVVAIGGEVELANGVTICTSLMSSPFKDIKKTIQKEKLHFTNNLIVFKLDLGLVVFGLLIN